MKAKTIVVAAVLLGLLAGPGWMLRPRLFSPTLPKGILEGHGRIEGTEVTASSKVSGRIVKLTVREGDRVDITYDLRQATAERIEARLAEIGLGLGQGRAERLRRGFVHYEGECEVGNGEAGDRYGRG